MGRAEIVNGGQNAKYNASILFDTDSATRAIASIDSEIERIMAEIEEIEAVKDQCESDIAGLQSEMETKQDAFMAVVEELY